jgi:hypothetical protein
VFGDDIRREYGVEPLCLVAANQQPDPQQPGPLRAVSVEGGGVDVQLKADTPYRLVTSQECGPLIAMLTPSLTGGLTGGAAPAPGATPALGATPSATRTSPFPRISLP